MRREAGDCRERGGPPPATDGTRTYTRYPLPPVRRRSRPAPERRIARGQARLLHLREASLGPLAKGLEQGLQRRPQGRQRVLDLRRYDRVNLPLDEPVALEVPQGLDEHFLRDPPRVPA